MSEEKTENNILLNALIKAQQQIGAAIKDGKNPHFKSDYATLEAVLYAVKEPLNNVGVLITQAITHAHDAWCVTTKLTHKDSGESMESIMPIVAKDMDDPQKLGSAITYARRYTLASLVALPAAKEDDRRFADDDDGNGASGKTDKKPAPQKPPAPPKPPADTEREKAKRILWNAAKGYGHDDKTLNTFCQAAGLPDLKDMTADQMKKALDLLHMSNEGAQNG
jgi:hypothetical protein